MNDPTIYKELVALLRPLGRRLRVRMAVVWLERTAGMALGACAIVLLAGRVFPIDSYRAAALGLLAAWLMGWMVFSLVRPISPRVVAHRVDYELELRDRLSTALAFAAPQRRIPRGFDPVLVAAQFDDALDVARSLEPGRAFPVRFERRFLAGALVPLLAAILLLALTNPMDAIVAQRAQVAQTAQAEAAKLEKLAQQIEQDKSLSPDERNELLRQMRELIAQLKANPGDAQKALADVAKFDEQLRSKLDPGALSGQAAMQALARQMAQIAGAKDTPQDAAETAKLLEQLASQLDKLSPEQRAALASALERAASQTAASNANLASALSAMAQAAQAGTTDGHTQKATQEAAQALRDAGNRQALQQALARSLNQSAATQRAMAQAAGTRSQAAGQAQAQGQGQGQGLGRGQSQGQGQNQGQGQGQGQNQGQGPGQGQGNQVGGGGGTNANSLPPAVRSGTAASPTGPNKSYGVGDLDTVYAPIHAGQGQSEFVGGPQNPNGETTSRAGVSPQPGANNSAIVPYNQVFQQYVDMAGQTMERSYIPSGLQDYVKEYFGDLEP